MSIRSVVSLSLLLLGFMFFSLPAYAQDSFSNVRVIFATNQTVPAGGRTVRWGEQYYVQEDQIFTANACIRSAWTYEVNPTPLGESATLEFPGNINVPGTLAYKCFWQVQEGSCRKVSGNILPYEGMWGTRYVVTSVTDC